MPLDLRLNYTLKSEEERKQDNRTGKIERIDTQSPRPEELVFLADHRFQRGEKKIYDTLNNMSFYTHLELHLNDQSFDPSAIVL